MVYLEIIELEIKKNWDKIILSILECINMVNIYLYKFIKHKCNHYNENSNNIILEN